VGGLTQTLEKNGLGDFVGKRGKAKRKTGE
jgi:hypothetical protein